MGTVEKLVRETRRLSVLKTQPYRVAAWICFNLLLFASLSAALGYRVELQRKESEAALRTAAVTLADSYSEQLARVISTVNEQTLTLKHYWEQSRGNVDLLTQWHAGLFGFKGLKGIAISDREGRLLTSTFPVPATASIASMPFFADFRDGKKTGLQIIAPFAGLVSNRPIIRFVRDLRDPFGAFDGVVSIGCPPSYFATASGMARLGHRDYLSIRDRDATVYVMQTRDSIGAGQAIFSHSPFPLDGRGFRELQAADFQDGVARYVAWAPVEGTNLIALTGLSVEDALSAYRQSKREYRGWALTWALFLAIACLGGLALYGRLLLRGLDAERVKRTYRLATEVAGEGFYMLEPVTDAQGGVVDFRIMDCNALGAKFMDFDAPDLMGKRISTLHPSRYGAQLIALFRRALAKGYEEAEVRVPTRSRYNVQWIHRKMVATEGSLAVTVFDITLKKQQEKALRETANTDSLTGLPNRHWLSNYLPQAIDKAAGNNAIVALFFVDLDNFKDINDTLGHHAGDLALRATADRLSTAVRPQDSVVRLGGDEFTVLVEAIEDPIAVKHLADRIIQELGKPLVIEERVISILSGSVGISLYPKDASDAEALLRHADTAMYVAKTNGKTCYAFYSPEIGRMRSTRLETERELREAMTRRDFVVHYQPRVDVKSGTVVGAEALVRWCHPTKGLIPPSEFIPLAEQTGLILELGEIVIDIVCGQIEKWSQEGAILVPISINVSPIQFNRRDIAALVIEHASRRSIPPHLIEIELTEAAMLESTVVLRQFADLTRYGIKLLVDDFGTGYSSLAQMQHFNLDVLKVDQALTAKLGKGPQAKVFYQAIVAMGHALNMTITAEGVETREQLSILDELACDEIQGFLIAQPLSEGRFQEFLRAFKSDSYDNLTASSELE